MLNRGFTLVEIIVVLLIVAVVLAVSLPAYQRYMDRARVLETVATIDVTARRVRDWQMAKGRFPDTLDELGSSTGKTVPLDPWSRPYAYFNRVTGTGNGLARTDRNGIPLNTDFELYSLGADGVTAEAISDPASRDDIVRARDGRIVALAEEVAP